jgi:hypothetical protein
MGHQPNPRREEPRRILSLLVELMKHLTPCFLVGRRFVDLGAATTIPYILLLVCSQFLLIVCVVILCQITPLKSMGWSFDIVDTLLINNLVICVGVHIPTQAITMMKMSRL